MDQLRFQRRDSSPTVCPYCRDAVGGESARTCPGCAAVFHPECVYELRGRCPNLGCGGALARTAGTPVGEAPAAEAAARAAPPAAVAAPERVAGERAARPGGRGRRAVVALVLLLVSALMSGALLAVLERGAPRAAPARPRATPGVDDRSLLEEQLYYAYRYGAEAELHRRHGLSAQAGQADLKARQALEDAARTGLRLGSARPDLATLEEGLRARSEANRDFFRPEIRRATLQAWERTSWDLGARSEPSAVAPSGELQRLLREQLVMALVARLEAARLDGPAPGPQRQEVLAHLERRAREYTDHARATAAELTRRGLPPAWSDLGSPTGREALRRIAWPGEQDAARLPGAWARTLVDLGLPGAAGSGGGIEAPQPER